MLLWQLILVVSVLSAAVVTYLVLMRGQRSPLVWIILASEWALPFILFYVFRFVVPDVGAIPIL